MPHPVDPQRRTRTVDTARLRLRVHTRGDFDESAAMWADPEVVRYIGGKPSTREEAWARLLRYAGHWTLMGFGYWVVREKVSGRFVGEVGFGNSMREIAPPFGDSPESGWALARWAHGQGFATEAVQAALAWGVAHFGPVPTVCMIDPGNLASIRVAEKCGYREKTRTSYKGEPIVVFER